MKGLKEPGMLLGVILGCKEANEILDKWAMEKMALIDNKEGLYQLTDSSLDWGVPIFVPKKLLPIYCNNLRPSELMVNPDVIVHYPENWKDVVHNSLMGYEARLVAK